MRGGGTSRRQSGGVVLDACGGARSGTGCACAVRGSASHLDRSTVTRQCCEPDDSVQIRIEKATGELVVWDGRGVLG